MHTIPCVIFAGGKSSRMGEDKAFLPFGGENTLIEFQYKRLSQIFEKVYISCKSKEKFDFLKAHFLEDTSEVFAPTTGFISIFKNLYVKQVFVLSVDTPFVTEKEIEKILSFADANFDAVVAKSPEGIHPMCALYSSVLLERFQEMLLNDNHRLGRLLKEIHTHYVGFESDEPFFNLNNPAEYDKALHIQLRKN